MRKALLALVVLLGLVSTTSRPMVAAQATPADLVLMHGKVITVDPKDSIAQAVAVTGGKIVAVGTDVAIQALVGEKTQVIDLHGRTMTPGLIDTHCHFSESDDPLSNLGDPSIKTIADVLALVKTAVAARQPGEAIRGGGWDEGKFKENRYLLASDLDTVAPNNPVWLTQTTGHYGVANSFAMTRAGITKDTKDPPAGTIDRDKDGNPTGVFKESAMGLVNRGLGGGGGGRGNGQGPDAG